MVLFGPVYYDVCSNTECSAAIFTAKHGLFRSFYALA
jgi:hypothetical protein